jgi:hypothetical protein
MVSFNPLYLLLILPALLGWYAQTRVRDVYEKFADRPNKCGVSGQEAAKSLLAYHRLAGVAVERTSGHLTDHYDPQEKKLRLSDGVANGKSITSLGIVAHEVGHAAQESEGYHFMRLRTQMAGRLSQLTQWTSFAFLGGMLFSIPILMALSALILAALVIFSVVTLPVERNASDRALASLEQTGLAQAEEREGVRQVLRAAAFTYLAGLGQRLATFLLFVMVIGMSRGA